MISSQFTRARGSAVAGRGIAKETAPRKTAAKKPAAIDITDDETATDTAIEGGTRATRKGGRAE